MDYKILDAQLTGRNANRRKLANNTYAERRGNDIAIRLHDTDILTFRDDGSVVVTSGGWKTTTTKDRLNSYLPKGLSIFQHKGVWKWQRFTTVGSIYEQTVLGVFSDSDTINRNGSVKLLAGKGVEKQQLTLRKQINGYGGKCAAALPLPKPGAGDCFYCQMTTTEGQSLGDASGNADHLKNHMEESYVVPSLVYRALMESGYRKTIIPSLAFGDGTLVDSARHDVKSAVRKYMLKRFGMAR